MSQGKPEYIPLDGSSPDGGGDASSSRMGGRRTVEFGRQRPVLAGAYPSNEIKTSKYTAWNFVPKNLLEQLYKFGNAYFLIISVLMFIGEKTPLFVGTIKAFSTLATLVLMMSATALMAWIDDQRRKESDRETNGQVAKTSMGTKKWDEITVGDFLVVSQDQELPADMVLFWAAEAEGNCYVSTANLDGETNLKLKTAPAPTQEALSRGPKRSVADVSPEDVLKELRGIKGSVDAEAPSTSIHDFQGKLEVEGTASTADVPLGFKALLLRGTMLRNTRFVVGMVVYTGAQTRMVMNSKPSPMKQSNLERITNLAMQVILLSQFLLAAFTVVMRHCTHCYLGLDFSNSVLWYLYPPKILLPESLGYLLTYFVLYSNLMPISLYPTMEFCNYFQSYFIKNDKKMYYKDPSDTEGFAARARSSNLCQELGQVAYLFSDKTGTLTRNIMELKKVYIDSVYGRFPEDRSQAVTGFDPGEELFADWRIESKARRLDDFWEVIAIAHTVVITILAGNQVKYEAESPDESALVEASKTVGWEFAGRQGETVTLRVSRGDPRRSGPGGQTKEDRQYRVLAVNAFDSDRKRMSVVVKRGDDHYLFVKGADNVMMPLLSQSGSGSKAKELDRVLRDFASEGLRTLVVARKRLEKTQAESWVKRQQEAQRSMTDRDKMLARVAGEIEKDLEVAGITAIEDKLQDGVPEAIKSFQAAGIKVWVLTGDKLETAINIGYSSQVLLPQPYMDVHELDTEKMPNISAADLRGVAEKVNSALQRKSKVGLVVTGAALAKITVDGTKRQMFLDEIAKNCTVVIACRVTPLQKAEMVRLVREGVTPTPVTLAIGDGANDVPMIQEAQVGLGIAGREGRQAVNNSDFAIGQFRFLERLLLVHGRWNYRRACKFTLYTFWRNAVQVIMIFGYTVHFSGFSGTSLFEDWIRLSFNFLCSFPIMATGIFDMDVSDDQALKHPELYSVGREGRDLNPARTRGTLYLAFVHAMILFTYTVSAFPAMDLSGSGDYYTFGTTAYTCLLVDMNYRVMFLSVNWNKYTVFSIFVSFTLYAVYLCIYPFVKPLCNLLEPNMYNVPRNMVAQPTFWICLVCIPAMATTVDTTISFLYYMINPEPNLLVEGSDPGSRKEGTNNLLQSTGLLGGQRLHHRDDGARQSERQQEKSEKLPNYINTSDFAQQRVPEWLRLKPNWCLQTFCAFVAGTVLLFFGWVSHLDAMDANQVRILYHGNLTKMSDPMSFTTGHPWGTEQKEVIEVDHRKSCTSVEPPRHGGSRKCTIDVELPAALRKKKQGIMVYYTVGPFYQNFHDYIKSEVPTELMGGQATQGQRAARCVEQTRLYDGKEVVPCGMKARSFFNDTFKIDGVTIDDRSIAWASDKDRYANPRDYDSSSKIWLNDLFPSVIGGDGVQNEHFLVWMRPSALTRIWNPYGYIQQDFDKGERLRLEITDRFPVTWPNGYKELVLTEINFIGGRHLLFARILICSSVLCYAIMPLTCVVAWCCRKPEGQDGAQE